MHLLGRALENPSAAAREKGVPDQHEIRAAIGEVAGGVARDVDHLEVQIEIWKGYEITALDRVVDRWDVLSSGAEDRNPACSEKLVDTADVVSVVMGEENCSELQLSFLENLDDERGLSGVHNHRRWGRRVGDEPDVVVGKSRHGFEMGHASMLPGNGGNSQSPEDQKRYVY